MDVGKLTQLHVCQVDVVGVRLLDVGDHGVFALDALVLAPWVMGVAGGYFRSLKTACVGSKER